MATTDRAKARPRRSSNAAASASVWKLGVEIELMAPPGVTRADLAERIAARVQGDVRRFFHPQSELGQAQDVPVFENLTLGFAVTDADGAPVARFVDDLTLQWGLDRHAPPRVGWYRVVADDARLLRLVMRHCDPAAPLETVLRPLAALFGSEVEDHAGEMRRVVDDRGVSVAIGAPLPGERERPCEIVTAPMTQNRESTLAMLLDEARALGFTLPREGATHLHFDAAPLASAPAVAALVVLFGRFRSELRVLMATNPHCVRLGDWPPALYACVAAPGFARLAWPEAQSALRETGAGKYCDCNLANLIAGDAAKHTVEIRILPSYTAPEPILAAARLFEAMLGWCAAAPAAVRVPETLGALIDRLPLTPADQAHWQTCVDAIPEHR